MNASHLTAEAFADAAFEAVIGSVVAAHSGLQVGDKFHPTHGLAGGATCTTRSRLSASSSRPGTANDRAVFINIEGFYLLRATPSRPNHHEGADRTANRRQTHARQERRHTDAADHRRK